MLPPPLQIAQLTCPDSLHTKYGPWVRVGTLSPLLSPHLVYILVAIGPNELSVNVPTAVRSVYKLDRGSFYAGAYITSSLQGYIIKHSSIGTPAKADSLITVMDRSKHMHRRQVRTSPSCITITSLYYRSKAWARAVTGDSMYSYIPSAQVSGSECVMNENLTRRAETSQPTP